MQTHSYPYNRPGGVRLSLLLSPGLVLHFPAFVLIIKSQQYVCFFSPFCSGKQQPRLDKQNVDLCIDIKRWRVVWTFDYTGVLLASWVHFLLSTVAWNWSYLFVIGAVLSCVYTSYCRQSCADWREKPNTDCWTNVKRVYNLLKSTQFSQFHQLKQTDQECLMPLNFKIMALKYMSKFRHVVIFW